QALLMSERVSSIFGPGMNPESDDLRFLADEGIWRPTFARAIYLGGYQREIEDTLLEFADHERFRVGGTGARPAFADLASVQVGKLAYHIESAFQTLDLAVCDPGNDRVYLHREVAAMVLSITAKYVAAGHRDPNSRMVPSTDQPIAERFAYDPLRRRADRYRRWELLLDGLVPVAGDTVSIPEVIAFREDR